MSLLFPMSSEKTMSHYNRLPWRRPDIPFFLMLLAAVLAGCHPSRLHEEDRSLPGSRYEKLPAAPWHSHLIDDKFRTPEGFLNPCAKWIDQRIEKALANQLQKLWPLQTWQAAPQFLNWAVWAYVSPDSRFSADERLPPMMAEWIDFQLKTLSTPPEDPRRKARWAPRRLGFWSFHDASIPLLELLARPKLAGKVGTEKIEQWRRLCLENLERWGTDQAMDDLVRRADTYVNIATHPMAVFVHGWILTGDAKYLRTASRIVHILARDQAPNGTFPYRKFGGDHLEAETMYYHAMNIRGLYLYWWHTGSKLAENIFRKSAPYYPLRMAPKYHFEDASAIWWKDQWRTFWPNHIAMTAAVSGDGENAKIANDMARDNRSVDRIDLTLGAHAYQQMGLRNVQGTPRRDNFLIEDPDVGGLRGRFGSFSFNFSSNSYSHTLAGAIVTRDEDKKFGALHRACPVIRVAPLEKAYRTSPDYWCLGKHSPGRQLILGKNFAAAAATYAPYQPSSTWRPLHRSASWKITQLWFYTPQGMFGLMIDEALETMEAREVFHLFKFILPASSGELVKAGDGIYRAGAFYLKIHRTNLERRIIEKVRRYELNTKGRRDWQLALSDTDRSPEHLAQDPKRKKESLKLPSPHLYRKGRRSFSLVEIYPETAQPAESVEFISSDKIYAYRLDQENRVYVVGVNFNDYGASFEYPAPEGIEAATLCRSWLRGEDARTAIMPEDGRFSLRVRESGVFVLILSTPARP